MPEHAQASRRDPDLQDIWKREKHSNTVGDAVSKTQMTPEATWSFQQISYKEKKWKEKSRRGNLLIKRELKRYSSPAAEWGSYLDQFQTN